MNFPKTILTLQRKNEKSFSSAENEKKNSTEKVKFFVYLINLLQIFIHEKAFSQNPQNNYLRENLRTTKWVFK